MSGFILLDPQMFAPNVRAIHCIAVYSLGQTSCLPGNVFALSLVVWQDVDTNKEVKICVRAQTLA